MCGRIALTTPDDELAELFGASVPEQYRPRYNIAPSQRTPVVRTVDGKDREIVMAQRGFRDRCHFKWRHPQAQTAGVTPDFNGWWAQIMCYPCDSGNGVSGIGRWQIGRQSQSLTVWSLRHSGVPTPVMMRDMAQWRPEIASMLHTSQYGLSQFAPKHQQSFRWQLPIAPVDQSFGRRSSPDALLRLP